MLFDEMLDEADLWNDPALENVRHLFIPRNIAENWRDTYRVYVYRYTPRTGVGMVYVGITAQAFGERERGHRDKAIRKGKGNEIYRQIIQAVNDGLLGSGYSPAEGGFFKTRAEADAKERELIAGFRALGWQVANELHGGDGSDLGNAAKTHEDYVARLAGRPIEVLEPYVSTDKKIKHCCIDCGHKWKVKPTSILSGKGCPLCGRKRAGEARRKWTAEKAEQEFIKAIECGVKSRKDLERSNSGLYQWLMNNAPQILDKHLPHVYTLDRNIETAEAELRAEIANGVKSRKDLGRGNSGLERWLRNNASHLLDKHLPSTINTTRTTETAEAELLAEIDNGIRSRQDLKRSNSGLYWWLRTHAPQILDKHLPHVYTLDRNLETAEAELLAEIADGVKSRQDLKRSNYGLYRWLRKHHPEILDKYLPSQRKRKA